MERLKKNDIIKYTFPSTGKVVKGKIYWISHLDVCFRFKENGRIFKVVIPKDNKLCMRQIKKVKNGTS